MKISKVKIYEEFHRNTNVQKKIIDINNFTYRILLGIIVKLIKPKKKVLDIGCGVGTIPFFLASQGNKVLGIDISKEAITACRKSANFLKLKKAFFQKMDFPQNVPQDTYDYILCLENLEHLKNDNYALKRIHSLLRREGVAIISVPSKNAPLYRIGYTKGFDERVGHLRRYDIQSLEKKCFNAGLTIILSYKTEGILRNYLFINPIAGKLLRFIKCFVSDIVSFLDSIFLRLFGESQIIVVVKKT